MAGFLRSHGAMMGLALSLLMAAALAPGAAGAEPGRHEVGGERGWDVVSNMAGSTHWAADENIVEPRSREELDAGDLSNPITMPTDGPNELALDGAESYRGGLKPHVAVRPQPQAVARPADVAMPRSDQAAPPAEGPSACGSTSLAVSFLMCVGMALLGLVVA